MRKTLLFTVLTILCQHVLSQIPVINSFSPSSGPVGTEVIIAGSNFNATAAGNVVYFGAVKAKILSGTTTSLTVTVPVGTTFQPVSVVTGNLIGYSKTPFIVTYTGGGMDFTATSFAAAANYGGGGFVTDGDLDGDGKTDLVVTDFSNGLIKILRNTTTAGTVTFASTPIGGLVNPIAVKAVDFNADGLLDLVVTNPTTNFVYVLKNSSTPGTMSFENPVSLGAGGEPRKVATGDLDGDGKTDIVVSNASGNSVSVFKNTSAAGNLSFNPKQDFATAATPEGVTVGDLDGDGKPEIAAAGWTAASAVSVLKNTSVPGTISFSAKVDYGTGAFPWEVIIADLDGDGKAELISSNSQPNNISVYRNTSNGSLTFATRVDFATFNSPKGMAVGDINADGKPDLVTANWSYDSKVSLLKNTSTPGSISFAAWIGYTTNEGPGSIVLADLNNDGLTDITSDNSYTNSLSYFKNQLAITVPFAAGCPQLLQPANNATNVAYGTYQQFKWTPVANATGYRIRITQQNGAYTEANLPAASDSYYFLPVAGINYTWTVTPSNLIDPNVVCAGFAFSTCAQGTNPVTITAEGPLQFCVGDSIKLRASSAANIQWFFNKMPVDGATADTIWATGAGEYAVRIKNGVCYSDPSNSIITDYLPTPLKPQLTVQGLTVFCEGGTVEFISSVNVNNQWFKNNGPISGANGSNYIANTTGNYFVRATNNSSGCSSSSDVVAVTVNPVPATPVITITGSLTLCQGDSVQLQSSAVAGNQWYKDGVAINGATGQIYKARHTGAYTVIVSQNNCSSPVSASVNVVVNMIPFPPALTIVSGHLTFCEGDSMQVQSVIITGNQWYKDGLAIAGATSQDIKIKQAGVYTITNTQNNCTSAQSPPFTVVVNPLPAKPVIAVTAGNLLGTATTYGAYQWYFNNLLITNAVTPQYRATQNGIYKVEVTDNKSCKNVSDDYNFVGTGLFDIVLQGYSISLLPNPVYDNLTVKVSPVTGYQSVLEARVIDANGRLMKKQFLMYGTNSIRLKNLPPGLYWVQLRNAKSVKTVKILKSN